MSDRLTEAITESCGCVFCDLGLDPDNDIGGRPVHMHRDRGVGYSFCTHDELDEKPTRRPLQDLDT